MIEPSATPKPSRKELEKQQRRREILDAATTIFVQKGYHNTTLDEVAQLAEFGKGTLYNYFQSKEDLFRAILEYQSEQMQTITMRALEETHGSLRDKLKAFALATFRHGVANHEVFHMIMSEIHQPRFDPTHERMKFLGSMVHEIWKQLANMFDDEIKAGRMRPVKCIYMAALLDSMIRTHIMTMSAPFWPLDPVPEEETIDMALDVFFNGVGTMKDKG
jgi:TetR/AcrR family transcriptional regulator, repressor of fatR-cypB operon